MRKPGKFIVALAVLCAAIPLRAQELNCNVQVISSQVQGSDRRIYETLQTAVFEFMNNRKWTDDEYLPEERIECNMLINITERVGADEFKATLQLQVSRPVYNSGYNTVLINYNDGSFDFRYMEYQPLEYNDNAFVSNLTSMLSFYAYLVLGLDYDTFSDKGGTALLLKAQNVVNNAQNANYRGWKSFETTQNRYWLIENLLNPSFVPLRDCLYRYHRQGLDVMAADMPAARNTIVQSIEALKSVHGDKPSSYLLQIFFMAKHEEIINIFQKADPPERKRIVETLVLIDPANATKYNRILTGQ